MSALPSELRLRVLEALRAGGETHKSIAARLQVSRSTVERCARDLREGVADRPVATGRPPALDAAAEATLTELVRRHRAWTNERLAAKLAEKTGVRITATTLGRVLTKRALPAKRELLSEASLAKLRQIVEKSPRGTLDEFRVALSKATGATLSTTTVAKGLKLLNFRRVQNAAEGQPEIAKRYGYTDRHRKQAPEQRYPSCVTDAEWELVKDLFERDVGPGRPESYSRREMLNAISYVLRTGASWRMLPKDFPRWENVYATFRRWSDAGLFEQMHDRMRAKWRERAGRSPLPTAAIIDSQSVKTAEKGGSTATTARRRSRAENGTS